MTEVDTKAYTITNADRFAPHITMRYVDPDNPPPLPVLDGPIDLPVSRISLVVGDERQDFDLGAPDGSHKMAVKEFDESLHPRDDRGRFGSGSSDSSVEGNSRLLAMEQDGLPSGATAASAAKQEVASRIAADMTSTTPAIVAAAAGDRGAGHTQVALQYLGDPNVVIATTGTGSLYVGRTVDAATWAAAHPEAGSIDPAWGTMSVNGPPYVGSLAEFAANPTEAIGRPVESFITADDPMASQVIREAAVSDLVGGWAATSNDEDPRSLALQDTATAMFGGTPAPWQTTPAMDARIGALISTNGPVYQDFLQAQYNATQSELKAAGITEVTGWRGVNFGGHDAVTAPAWAGALGPGQSTTVEANLRPLSSWTTVPSVAERFAAGLGTGTTSPGYMMQTSIPVDRILSWPRTGLGCLAEHEMVVLNGPGSVTVTATAPAKAVAHATQTAGPVDINFDEDWIKTLSWDLPTNAADLRAMGLDPAHLATLPCGVAMPAALRASLERPAKARRPRYATKGALLPAGASIATHRSRLESEAHVRREAVLKQILPVIRRQFDRQKKTTLARLGGEKARKGTRYWRPANGSAPVVTRQIKASDVFNADTWSEDWTGDLTPTMTDVFSAEGADAADEMDAAWDPENDDDLQAAIAAIVAKQVGNSALAIKTTQDRIDALIKAAEDGSWDQSTLTDEVGSYFDAPARQSEIATVLAVGAIAGAGLLAATIAGSAPADGGTGTPMTKSWMCVAGDTIVSGIGASYVARRWYEGSMVTLTTSSGRVLTVTANHPVLTDRGWVLADGVDVGDNLIGHVLAQSGACLDGGTVERPAQGIASLGPDVQDVPSKGIEAGCTADELWSRARMMGGVVDLYGDGNGGQVEVVALDGELADSLQPTGFEPSSEEFFALTDLDLGALFANGDLGVDLVGTGVRPAVFEASGSKANRPFTALGGSHPRCTHYAGLRLSTKRDAVSPETHGQDGWRKVEGDAKLTERLAVEIEAGDLLDAVVYAGSPSRCHTLPVETAEVRSPFLGAHGIEVASVGGCVVEQDTPLTQAPANRFSTGIDSEGKSGWRLAGDIAPNEIIHVKRDVLACHVYDITTVNHWYLANGFVVHNSMQDERVRPDHAEADDGSFIPIDEPFSVGGEDLMYPADPSGSAEQVCGCRCILAFSPGPDTAQPDQSLEPDYSAFTEATAPHWLLERKAPAAPHWILKRKSDAFVCDVVLTPRDDVVVDLE